MIEFALLVTALMFGGTVLYAFGFAAFLFTALPADTAGPVLRRAFPHFYLFVIGTSAVAAAVVAFFDPLSAGILVAIAASGIYARQVLMPAINRATDEGEKARFKRLHWVSVVITLIHIAAAAVVIIKIAGQA
ncbi:MAG: DUF4149 domain-containing protein [Pseudomonadota bacterium]